MGRNVHRWLLGTRFQLLSMWKLPGRVERDNRICKLSQHYSWVSALTFANSESKRFEMLNIQSQVASRATVTTSLRA